MRLSNEVFLLIIAHELDLISPISERRPFWGRKPAAISLWKGQNTRGGAWLSLRTTASGPLKTHRTETRVKLAPRATHTAQTSEITTTLVWTSII